MATLTTTIFKYSLTAAGVGTSAVVPLVYSSGGSKVSSLETKKETGKTKSKENQLKTVSADTRSSQVGLTQERVKMNEIKPPTTSLKELKEQIRVSRDERKVLPVQEGVQQVPVEPKEDLEAQSKAYQEFVYSLWNILRSTLWVDEKFGLPWISQVSANIPSDKLEEFKEHAKISQKEEDKLQSVEFSLTKEDVSKMKQEDTKKLVQPKREAMYDVFARFCFSPNWEKLTEDLESELKTDNYKSREILCSFGGVSSQTVENVGVVNTLTLVRSYDNQLYFLDIYFNSKDSHNQLMIQYVSYKDNAWWSAGYYQANGEYDNYRRHIGGNIESDRKAGIPVTAIDRDFASMFKDSSSSQESIYKLVTSISKCLLDTECSIMFHREKDDFQELAQRTPGISKSDSWREEVYRTIHPFSRTYWEIDKKVRENPRVYSQFLTSDIKTKVS